MAYTGRNVRPLATLTGASISDGTVDTADLADAAITARKVAANALTANTYAVKSISTAAIADAAITSAKIAASTINANNIATLTSNITLDGADLILGDTDKIRLGDSQDLEIYHDGTNSIINDNGTGNIQLAVGGTAKAQLDASGNFGVGISPSAKLDVFNSAAAAQNNEVLRLRYNTSTTAGHSGDLNFTNSTGTVLSRMRSIIVDGSNVSIGFGVYGSGTLTEKFLMEPDGDFHADGDVIAYSTTVSDERLKEDITLVDNALEKVNQLKGVTFKYKTDGKVSAGVIAQDVEKVLPEAVTEKEIPLKMNDGEAYKTVRYDALHALLIEAIKELSAEVKLLKEGK